METAFSGKASKAFPFVHGPLISTPGQSQIAQVWTWMLTLIILPNMVTFLPFLACNRSWRRDFFLALSLRSLGSEDIHGGLAPQCIRKCQKASRAMFLSGGYLLGDWSRTGLPTRAQWAVGESRSKRLHLRRCA